MVAEMSEDHTEIDPIEDVVVSKYASIDEENTIPVLMSNTEIFKETLGYTPKRWEVNRLNAIIKKHKLFKSAYDKNRNTKWLVPQKKDQPNIIKGEF